MSPERRTFISYHVSTDRATAFEVCRMMEQLGFPCWIAPRNIEPGANYPTQIVRALRSECDSAIFLVSEGSNRSENVRNEVSLAFDEHKLMLPVLLETVKFNEDFEYYFKRAQWADAQPDLTAAVLEVAASVAKLRGLPAPDPARLRMKDAPAPPPPPRPPRGGGRIQPGALTGFVPGYISEDMEDVLARGTAEELAHLRVCDCYQIMEAGRDPGVYGRVLAKKIVRDKSGFEETLELILSMPMNWKVLLTEDGKLVGYWFLVALDPDFFAEVMTGQVDEANISLRNTEFIDLPGHYKGYLLLSGTVPRARTPKVVQMLYNSLALHLSDLAENDIYFDEFGSMVGTPMGMSGMRSLGMEHVNDYCKGGKMYYYDMRRLGDNPFFGRFQPLRSLYEKEFACE